MYVSHVLVLPMIEMMQLLWRALRRQSGLWDRFQCVSYMHYTLSTMPKSNDKCLCVRTFDRERVNKWICLADIMQNNFVWIWMATLANWQQIQWTCFQSCSSAIFVPNCFQFPNSTLLLQSHFCCSVDP